MNVKTEGINSAEIRVSNAGDTDRRYDITANVNLSGGMVNGIHSGTVTDRNTEETQAAMPAVVASFSSNMEGHIQLDTSDENKQEILAGVEDFVNSVREAYSGDLRIER